MEDPASKSAQLMDTVNGIVKRKRSVSQEAPTAAPAPPTKAAKTHSSHLQINYLVRQYSDVLPLVSATDDAIPSILQTLADYSAVLERHESLAGNLGARPLGPILIKRFERLFDGAPRVLKSHGKEGTTVTWLDVVEFARLKPEQFNLEKMRDGVRVCQFYTKQSRVEISEEDFLLISSGMPQKLIPPQPIAEDEEKELGTLEIMEKSVAHVIQLADQVSARARQTKHRLTARKNAIASRREAEAAENSTSSGRPGSADKDNGAESPTGFIAVNTGRTKESASNGASFPGLPNGKVYTGSTASPTTKAELMHCFTQQRERMAEGGAGAEYGTPTTTSRAGQGKGKGKHGASDSIDGYASILLNSASPVPIPNTPSNLVSYPRPAASGGGGERYDDSGPYKQEMLSRMDSMNRGDRVMPPCDRCRRLHMDCLKNLTACLGCTKKHAKCSWKDVTAEELKIHPHPGKAGREEADAEEEDDGVDAEGQGVRDEELLGEDDSDDDAEQPKGAAATKNEEAPSEGGSGTQDASKEASSAMEIDPKPGDVSGSFPRADADNTSSSTLANADGIQAAAAEILKKRLDAKSEGTGISDDEGIAGGLLDAAGRTLGIDQKKESKSEMDIDVTDSSGNEERRPRASTGASSGAGFASVNGVGA